MLTLPEGTKCFVIYCDSCQLGLGFDIMQQQKVISYAFRILKVHKRNYPSHDPELEATVFALQI